MVDLNKVSLAGTKGLSDKGSTAQVAQYENGISNENKTNFANLDNKVTRMREGSPQPDVSDQKQVA